MPPVLVRPNPPVTLASIGVKASAQTGTLVAPGLQFGILFRPAPELAPSLVEQLVVRWRPNHPTAGRVRIRLVGVQADSLRSPSPYDLIPFAAIYTAAQLAALSDQVLRIDLSAYGLRLPPEGVYILVEGLPTDPAETAVVMQRDDPTPWQRITATDPLNPATYRRTPASAFPALRTAESVTTVQTLVREFPTKPWRTRQTSRQKKVANVDLSLVVRAQ
ncbi:hypothetical protein DNI29_21620 [Hymenobacter sediminis]|uniref:hypothetical protein n=1 Tax=Hymenobacter sediminis TaxID=2218621 RepID=UPI000F4D524A|nr:hypothetical protein [Hymenobacter sediminis]RPD44311.1 hypothetical protein DNI29_21620 [Hymenobacter sediminis]